MARKSGVTIKVTKKMKVRNSTKYAMAEKVAEMTRNELAKECRRYFDMANKRINRLQANHLLSPALHAVLKEGKFYAKGKDLNQLRHEYARVFQFLNMETSTVTGARAYEAHLVELMGGTLSDKQRSLLFDVFRRLKEISPAGLMEYGSDKMISYLANEITSEDANIENGPDLDVDWLVHKAHEEILSFYNRIEAEFNDTFRNPFTI